MRWSSVGVGLYIILWLVLIVALQYRAEMQLRRINALNKELRHKRALYLTLAAHLSQKRSYQHLKAAVQPLGLFPPTLPPKKLPTHAK
ncbi:MAG: FtsL-like putative cell division protein [Bacteroidia bacterium]